MAAAGLYALQNNVERLSDDHQRAEDLAKALTELAAGDVTQSTNMIFLTPRGSLNDHLRSHMAKAGVILGGGSNGAIRIVLHKGIDDEALAFIATEMRAVFG